MPRLETERLILRPPEYCDVAALTRLAGDYDVAKNLAGVPHPLTEADGRTFVTKAHERRALGEGFCFAILEKESGAFMGCCALRLAEGRYSVGCWLGKPFWNRGYGTEALRKLVAFAFHDLRSEQVWASWFDDDPASGRVLEKIGFRLTETYSRQSRARGHVVACNRMVLVREEFGRKKARPAEPALHTEAA